MKQILLLIGIILLVGNVNASVGYSEINLYDHKTNNFIHVNSSIPLTNYTYELKPGVNWVGMPFNTTINNARDLLMSIPNTTYMTGDNVKWWNFSSQGVETYLESPSGQAGINFEVKPNRGYEICVGKNTTWTLCGLQPTNPTILYEIFDLNKYYGTNIIRVRNI